MTVDLVDLYRRAGDWAAEKLAGTPDLDAPTPCEGWQVRDLLAHVLDTQRFFLSAARGESASPPSQTPPPLPSPDPVADFEQARSDVLAAFGQEGVVDKTGPLLGIAFSDLLLHGWDLARATGRDATMPDGLAQAAYDHIHGRFDDDQRVGVFKPELPVPDDATPQQRLLAYTGRDPAGR